MRVSGTVREEKLGEEKLGEENLGDRKSNKQAGKNARYRGQGVWFHCQRFVQSDALHCLLEVMSPAEGAQS